MRQTANQFRGEPDPDTESGHQEQRGFAGGGGNREETDGAGNGEAAHYGENDETEDVVDDRRPENDAGFFAGFAAEVAQDAGGDADARGREDAADEEIDGQGILRMEKLHHTHAEDHGQHDAQDGHVGGVLPDALHFHQADFQADH